jgi:hypothetical protein
MKGRLWLSEVSCFKDTQHCGFTSIIKTKEDQFAFFPTEALENKTNKFYTGFTRAT